VTGKWVNRVTPLLERRRIAKTIIRFSIIAPIVGLSLTLSLSVF
jgi:hypothetical protein